MLPREKLIKLGAKELTDSELLAIMLGTGNKDEDVFELSKRLINTYGLDRLFKMEYKDLSKIKGIKLSKATKLLSSFEITRRIMEYKTEELKLINSIDVFNYVKSKYLFLDYELLTVLFVDNRLRIIKEYEYSDKISHYTYFPIKDIVMNALNDKAFGIFLIHNHPGGNIKPSISDINATKELLKCIDVLDIKLLDHLIISKNNYYSILDN